MSLADGTIAPAPAGLAVIMPPDHVVLLAADGTVMGASVAWSDFVIASGLQLAGNRPGLGMDYGEVCARACGLDDGAAATNRAEYRRVLDGRLECFAFEYVRGLPSTEQWYRVMLRRVAGMDPVVATAMHSAVVPEHSAERAAEALRRSEEGLRDQFETLPFPTHRWRMSGDDFVLTDANAMARRGLLVPGEMAIGRTSTELFPQHPELDHMRRRCLRENRVMRDTVRVDLGRGARVFELTMGPQLPEHVLVHAVDVTERVELEAHLRETEKLKAAGQVARGIAHDFNNLLTVILSYAQMVRLDLPPGHEDRGVIEEIEHAAARAAVLTRQLLGFSSAQRAPSRALDLVESVRELQPLLLHVIGADVTLDVALEARAFALRAEPGELGQVLITLLTNANDAMPDGGTIRIDSALVELDEIFRARHPDAQQGPHLRLRVSDTGHGMDQEVLARAFEPFFTTPPRAERTGLGLSTVHGIVRQWGGYVHASSVVGGGTTISIYLPSVTDAAALAGEEPVEPATLAVATPVSPSHATTILLVDDDDGLRGVARMVLTRAGYRVMESSNGIDALRLLDEMDNPVDVVLSDMVMPGMGGRDLAYEVRIRYPDAGLVLMSGYSRAVIGAGDALQEDTVFVQKPFTPGVLLQAIRDACAARPAAMLATAHGDLTAAVSPAPQDGRAVDALINGIDAVVWEADASTGHIHYVSRRAESLLGYPRAHWHGDGFASFILHADDRPRVQSLRERAARTHEGFTAEYRVMAANGATMWVRDVVAVVPRRAGTRDRLGGVLFDITDARSRMEELRLAKDTAERADSAKSQFLALVSHELHTPLNAVIGFANVLRKNRSGTLSPQDLSYAERIAANSLQLLGIVRDVLDLTRLQAGTLPVSLAPVTLATLVPDAVRNLEGAAHQKQLELRGIVPPGLDDILADPARLLQVLTNIIGNAVKYSATGHVEVRVVASANGNTAERIEVEDTGPGISGEKLEAMFSPFYQEENFTQRRHGGAGMGLGIARGLCERMGFRLSLESTVGVGSTCTIHLVSP